MKNKIKIGLFSVLFSAFFASSCAEYPSESDYVVEQLVAVTSFDTNVNFKDAKYKYFAMADSATYIKDDNTIERVLISSNSALQKATDAIVENMKSIGYTQTALKNEADLGLTLTVVKSTTVYVTYPWWWYGGYCYWDWWDCGYYPYPYPYPYPVVSGGYTVGTAIIDMFDVTDGTRNSNKDAVWTGVVRGLDTGTHSQTDVTNAINDCFNQTTAFQKK